ncbi:MAG: LysM peptidoglycan-binding domain-containing protein [Verrucomicrobiota bacterium]
MHFWVRIGTIFSLLLILGCDQATPTVVSEVDETHFQRGRELLSQNRKQEALAAFLRVLDKRDEAPETHFEIGEIFLEEIKDPIQAIYHYTRFLEQAPGSANVDRVRQRIETGKKMFLHQFESPQIFSSSNRVDLLDLLDNFKDENKRLKRQVEALRQDKDVLGKALAEAQGEAIAVDPADANRGQPAADFWSAPGEPERVPSSVPTPTESGVYVVESGDTLSKISREVYGTSTRYMDIFNANRELLRSPADLKPGQRLRIP